jgi:heme exporter protein D
MSYREYVIAAYLVFAAMLAWDYVVPRVRIRQLLRAARLLAARRAAAVQPDPAGELPR